MPYEAFAGEPPCVVRERRAASARQISDGHSRYQWTPPLSITAIETLAILGAIRLASQPDAPCRAGWDGVTLHYFGVADAALTAKVQGTAGHYRNIVRFGQFRYDYNDSATKFWAGQITLVRIVPTAREAWKALWGLEDLDKPLDTRAQEPFSATGWDSLNVGHDLGFSLARQQREGRKIKLVGGRPMLELLALAAARPLETMGCWPDKYHPRIPLIAGTPLLNWADVEREIPNMYTLPTRVEPAGKRAVLIDG